MKNTIKMSLVAALAVAGLSQTASAGSLEEAIKGVSISGKMEVEYDYTNSNNGATTTVRDTTVNDWDIDWDITAKIPVNDNVTAVMGAQSDTGVNSATERINDAAFTTTKFYFQYANGPVTALVGKQGMAGAPWFDDERANGVVGLYNAGPVTLAAAHFTGTNAAPVVSNATINTNSVDLGSTGTSDFQETQISAVAAIGSMGPVNAQLWYAELSGLYSTAAAAADQVDADSWALIADINLDVATVTVKYAEADYSMDNPGAAYNKLNDDAEMLQVIVSGDVAGANLYAGYGATDSKQGGAGLDLTADTDSTLDFGSEQLSIDDLDNAEAFIIGGSMPFGALTIGASYVWGDYDDYIDASATARTTAYKADFSEFLIEADYAMSKNFNIGAHYSDAEIEDQTAATVKNTQDLKAASVSLEYKF